MQLERYLKDVKLGSTDETVMSSITSVKNGQTRVQLALDRVKETQQSLSALKATTRSEIE